jgi:long-chain acyl-CoA synthetase
VRTIDQLIGDSCQRHADSCALQKKSGGNWIDTSYRSLWDKTEILASSLRELDITAQNHVAILAPSSPAWVACYLGILRNSGIAIPVDKELKATELRHILADSEAKLIFVGRQQLEILLEIIEDLPLLKKIVVLDAERQREEQDQTDSLLTEISQTMKGLITGESLTKEQRLKVENLCRKLDQQLQPPGNRGTQQANNLGTKEALSRRLREEKRLIYLDELSSSTKPAPATHSADDCAVILYTSGTTGRSKGAMLSHANIVSNIQAACKQFRLDSNIHTLSFLPINHIFEQVCDVLLPLSLGGKVSFAESLKKLGENLREIKPSFLLGVPAVYRLLYDRIMKNINSKPLSRILFNLPVGHKFVSKKVQKSFGKQTIFVSGGAALDPCVAAGFKDLGLTLLQGYGITETSPVITAETPDIRKIGTVGVPLEGIEIRIGNPDTDGAGEIQVRGPNVMLGYYKNEPATNEVLRDGWYNTGDLGSIDSEGLLSIRGRAKNLIVTSNGKNVYPEEVENQLLNSPFIAEVVVFGRKIDRTSEEVYASIFPCEEALFDFQQQQNKSPLSSADVELLIRREVVKYGKDLADYKRVKKFSLRGDEFPKTTTRKIKRYVLEPDISAED